MSGHAGKRYEPVCEFFVGVSVNVHILSYVYLVFVEDPCVTIFLMLFRIFSRRSYRAANKDYNY